MGVRLLRRPQPRVAAALCGPLLAGLLLLAGCVARPPVPPPPGAPPSARSAADAARDDYEARLRAQAVGAMGERRWYDASLAWELLATLRPADPLIAERLSESRERNEAAVADLEQRADLAQRRGDLEGAAQRWWDVLAIDPLNESAATALRKLEADRNRRTYLGRRAGGSVARRANAESETMPGQGPKTTVPAPAAGGPRRLVTPSLAAASSPGASASAAPGARF